MKFLKLSLALLILIILNGCIQSTALVGPGFTLVTTGNAFQAGFQYGANSALKKETGKDALMYFKDAVNNKKKEKEFEAKFKQLVENRVQITREKLFITKSLILK